MAVYIRWTDACHDNGLIEQIMDGTMIVALKLYYCYKTHTGHINFGLYPYGDFPTINLRHVSQLQTEITANARQTKNGNGYVSVQPVLLPPPPRLYLTSGATKTATPSAWTAAQRAQLPVKHQLQP